jgi:tetratricopeptide (TPR) repeat protein
MISEQKEKLLALFAEGRKHYKLMDFEKARACFEEVLQIDPNDGPSKLYVDRCADYLEEPPPADWDGVYVMKTK